MFTGIVLETAKIAGVSRSASLTRIKIASTAVFEVSEISDSIAVNGVCLTLVKKENSELVFEAIEDTIKKTNLKKIKITDYVNLEPALKVGDKLGGHFVLGHVDTTAKLIRVIKKSDCCILEIELLSQFRKYLVENGSIAIEGVSLTVKNVLTRYFTVNIIPFTFDNTNLKYKKSGDLLNVEFDYLLKQRR
jgi:riboflavin synthase